MRCSIGASVEVFYYPCKNDKTKADLCPPMARSVESVVEEGLGVELWTSHHTWEPYSLEDIAEIRNIARCAPIVSTHTSTRRWKPDAVEQELRIARDLGASIYVVHADTLGMDKTLDPPDFHRIADLAQMAREQGLMMALENGAAGFGTLIEALEQIGDDPKKTGLGICVDVGHVYYAKDRREHPVCDYLRAFKDQLVHIHAHDVAADVASLTDASTIDHFVPGDGDYDWEEIGRTLREIQFSGCLMMELLRPGDPMELVRRGRRFLTNLMDGTE